MAKKKKKSLKEKKEASLYPDYSNPKEVEQMTRVMFQKAMENVSELRKKSPAIGWYADMDSARAKRREKATIAYAPRVKELAAEVCPDVPILFYLEEEWAHINSLPITSYDAQEATSYLTTAAAIWILDRIKESGKIQEATKLLPKDDGTLDDVYMPSIWDPVHQESVIRSMTYLIQERNSDCLLPGQHSRKKRDSRKDELAHVLADSYTVKNLQRQDVPSRKRFESLLALVPQEEIEKAVREFEKKLNEWIVCYFRCRRIYAKREEDLYHRRTQFEDSVEARMSGMLTEALSGNPPQVSSPLPVNFAQQNRLKQLMSDPLQMLTYIEEKYDQFDQEAEEISSEVMRFICYSHRLGTAPYARIKRDFGEEIADIVSAFSIDDPYEICFALFYLLDSGNDLPWLYYPGTVIVETAGAMLPWDCEEYDETEDVHWLQYYGGENEGISENTEPKNLPEMLDWYRLDYVYRGNDLDFQERNNLAQIVYELTGGLMPRNLHRYDSAVKYLRDHGITGKKIQLPLLYCISLLGEGHWQTDDWRLQVPFYDFPEQEPEDQVVEKSSETQELQGQIAMLKKENEHLRTSAYTAEREIRELEKKQKGLLRELKEEQQELAELREILFSQENAVEAELAEEAHKFFLPYRVNLVTVIFGGHETWAKAIRPLLQGDVRFVDRGMRPDANLIRNADVVWIQPNSISHADYYKIINIVRARKIPLHYFKFASAEKCARQLAVEDAKASV